MKRIYPALIVILLIIFVAFIAIIIRNSQTYSTTRKVIDQKEYSIVDNKSQEEVEQENLAKLVEKKHSDTINTFRYSDSEINLADNKLTSINYYKLNTNSTIERSTDKVNANTVAVIYANSKITYQKDIVSNLSTLILEDKFGYIELEKNIGQYLPDFLNFIKELSLFTKANDIKLIYSTYPYWGANVNYAYFYNYSPLYSDYLNVSLVNDYVDFIRIHTYFYTNTKSVLAGEISPINLVENSVRFFLLKNIPSNKIQIVINTKGLLWDYVDYVEDYTENFIETDENAIIQTQAVIKELTKQKINSQIKFDNGEILYYLENKKTLVTPTENTYIFFENLAKDYSLDGVVYR